MLADLLTIYIGAIGAAEILDERVVEDSKYLCVVTADREVIDMDIIVRLASDS
jgi:hypothetical protein